MPASGEFDLEAHVLRSVSVDQTDTSHTTVLHVRSLDLVVTGDAVYGECFQYLQKDNTPALQARWLKAIDKVAAWKPKIVVPSHKQPWDGFGADHLENTKGYLKTWGQQVKLAKNKDDLKSRIMKLYPQRIGGFILEIGAEAAFPAAQ